MTFLIIKTLISSFPGALKAEYKHYAATITADLDLGLTALNASAVIGHKGWLAGYQTSFDLAKFAFTINNFGFGYTFRNSVLHTSITNNGTEFRVSKCQKLSPALETGVTLGWSTAGAATKFGIGAKYVLADGAVIRAKVNNSGEVGLGYQQKLRDGVTVTLSTLINVANFNAVRESKYCTGCIHLSHEIPFQRCRKVGVALEISA